MSGIFSAVPAGFVLTSGANSALTWTNAVSVSSISASTLNASNLTVSTLATSSSVTASTLTTGRLNYSSIVGSSISTNAMTLSLTNASTQNTQIYQVATTDPLTSYTAIQASHVSTGTTNNALALNPSGGNVGVGVTTASAPLHVNTASSGLANGVLFVNSNNTLSTAVNSSDILQQWSESTGNGNNVNLLWNRTTAGSDWTTASQRFQARTDASWQGFIEFNGTNNNNGVTIGAGNNTSNPNSVSSVMTIKNGGNVGIGTTAPSEKLQVNGNIYMGSGYRNLSLSGGNSNGYLYGCFDKYGDAIHTGYNFYNNNTSNVIPNAAGGTSRLSLGYGTIAMYTGGVNSEPTNLGVYQQSDGNVGIGTTAPAAPLHVNGISLFGTSTSRLSLGGGMPVGEKGLWMLYDSTNNYGHIQVERQGAGYSPLILNANGGNVGIGTTAPGYKLEVNGVLRSMGTVGVTPAGATTSIMHYWWTGSQFAFSADNVLFYYISPNSDYRIKENIQTPSPILNRLCAVNMIEYEFKTNGIMKTDGKRLGVFAHELQEAFPEYPNIVIGAKDAVNEDGSIRIQSISGEAIGYLVMKAVQELATETSHQATSYEMRIQELSTQLAAKSAALDALIAWAQTQGYSAPA